MLFLLGREWFVGSEYSLLLHETDFKGVLVHTDFKGACNDQNKQASKQTQLDWQNLSTLLFTFRNTICQ